MDFISSRIIVLVVKRFECDLDPSLESLHSHSSQSLAECVMCEHHASIHAVRMDIIVCAVVLYHYSLVW